MSKSKRISQLEVKVEALTIISEALLRLVSDLLEDKEIKDNLDSGKWYKETP